MVGAQLSDQDLLCFEGVLYFEMESNQAVVPNV